MYHLSSIAFLCTFIQLPIETLFFYRYGLLLMTTASILNHNINTHGVDISNNLSVIIQKIDHFCIVFACSISLVRYSKCLIFLILYMHNKYKIQKQIYIFNSLYHFYLTNYKKQMIISFILSLTGFNFDKRKTWTTYKRWLWHIGAAINVYYIGLCVNIYNKCS